MICYADVAAYISPLRFRRRRHDDGETRERVARYA